MIGSKEHLDALRRRAPADKPCIAITMGDPAGIGAEVIVKALADPEIRSLGRFIIYGMEEPLDVAAGLAELDRFWFRCQHEEVTAINSGIVLADFDEFGVGLVERRATAEGGRASLRFVDEAILATVDGTVDAIVTGPIHKLSWHLAGRKKTPGHTELLSERFKRKRVAMLFVGGPLRIALASRHIGLFALRNRFNIGCVFEPIDLLDEGLRRYWGIERPRIAVAGLNPHAGDDGLFGDEESRVIEPAILMARELGINALGPFPADSLFAKAMHGGYDGIVAMYHDQGLIPVKMIAFRSAVNVTLGLPTIRTSVDHGTAFDIVGKNIADPTSMKAALQLACELAANPAHEIPRIPLTLADDSLPRRSAM